MILNLTETIFEKYKIINEDFELELGEISLHEINISSNLK